ncbi:MAG: discoidin domain-containing protein [Candidatus Baldrarchaeota archaeon]
MVTGFKDYTKKVTDVVNYAPFCDVSWVSIAGTSGFVDHMWDNDLSTGFRVNACTNSSCITAWVKLDYLKVIKVSTGHIAIHIGKDNQRYMRLRVEISDDDVSYTTIYDTTDHGSWYDKDFNISFANKSFRYLKIVLSPDGGKYHLEMYIRNIFLSSM